MRQNKIIDTLKLGPCTSDELPYKPSSHRFGVKNREILRKIRVSRRSGKCESGPYGTLKTVYYLNGGVNAAVTKFVKVNFDILTTVDFSGNNYIHGGLPKGMGSLIRQELNIQKEEAI